MQAARATVTRMFDRSTGDIILRGVGMERLSQALEAGLVADTIRSDVESVKAENTNLKEKLGAARKDARLEAQKASKLRREKLEGYMHEQIVREDKRSIREIAYGFMALGMACGISIMGIVTVMMM